MSALSLLLVSLALAQDPAPPAEEAAPPAPAEEKPAEEKPAEKAEKQWRWAALPIANVSSTYGIGYGAYGNFVNNGKGDLGGDPYRAKIAAQLYFTTGSYYDHFVKLDFPGILGSRFRWDFQAGITGWPTASWYGTGNDNLRIPIEEGCDPEAAGGVLVDPLTQVPCYYNYGQKASVKVITNLRRDITGPWSAFVNYYFRSYTLDIYPGSLVDLTEPVGVDGGLYTRLGLGVMYDTRNQEPSPTAGVFAEASVRGGMNLSDPEQRVVAVNITDKRWVGFGKRDRVVLASREILDAKWGDEPFFMSQTIGGSEDLSIGTSVLMRGFAYGRFSGDGAFFWTPELRWHYASIPIGSSKLDLMTGPYLDVGRVWLWDPAAAGLEVDDPMHLHYAYGLGNRIIFNDDLVVRLDLGFGKEEYVSTYGTPYSENNFGLFLVFDHPY